MTRQLLILATLSLFVALPAAGEEEGRALPAPRRVALETFATSRICAMCHSFSSRAQALTDASGRSVAPFDLWQSTMMANSTRDPLWRAVVSVERAATPSKADAIAAKCVRCHAPMSSGAFASLLADTDEGQLALDGVSCTLCHQVRPERLGTPASFSGGFLTGDDLRIYGPHEDPFFMPMRRHTGYLATHSRHVLAPSLCGSCHTLTTEALRPDGGLAGGALHEQTPYLEWRNSWYSTEGDEPGPLAATCQDCHAPTTDEDGEPIRTGIARNPGGRDFGRVYPREPFGRHLFVGGNVLVPAILRDHADVLAPQADREALDATLAATRRQLTAAAARIGIERAEREDGVLRVSVRVRNLAGHKLPTGHPTRRAWIRLRVKDAEGRVVFASGEHDERGRILAKSGRPLPSESKGGPVLPHRLSIADPDHVQVYEGRMADAAGKPTWLLMRGVRFGKDNRLLPVGRTEDHPDAAATRPAGLGDDPDFRSGGDTVGYEAAVARTGLLTVEAALLYQPLGARYAAEILAYDTPETRDLRRFLASADLRPVVLGQVTVILP